jgi:nucleoside-diphosphate-sugar epimerase
VTGGSGFVGSHIAAWLADEGALVRAIVRKQGDHPGLGSPRITQLEGDFTDPATAQRACDGARLVFHAAATVGTDLADALRVNATGTAVLAAAARAAGCERFIHISTVSVYNFQSGDQAYDEGSPMREVGKKYAHSPAASPHYGIAKAEAERRLRAEMARGLPATIFRLGAVLGLHPTSVWVTKVPAKVRLGQVPLRGDGSDLMPMTHVDNVVRAIALALDHPASIGRAYNVVDEEVTWAGFIGEMRSWFPEAPPAPVIPAEKVRPEDAFVGHCPDHRTRAELGYAPVRTYAEGMAEAKTWWTERGAKS